MLLVLLLLLCVAIVAYGVWSGSRSGAVAQLFGLGSLLLCYLVAGGIAWTGVSSRSLHFIPLLLQPFVLGAVVALVLYVVLAILSRRKLIAIDEDRIATAKAAGAEVPGDAALSESEPNLRWGMGVGAIKALALAAVFFLAVQFIGSTTVMTESVLQAREKAGEPPQERTPIHKAFLALGQQIRSSPVARVTDRVAPVKDRQFETLGKLSQLTNDEAAMERFRRHPRIKALMKNPRILALTEDKKIAAAIEGKQWMDLMDQPAVVALARDRALQQQIMGMDFEKILNTVLTKKRPAKAKKPAKTARRRGR